MCRALAALLLASIVVYTFAKEAAPMAQDAALEARMMLLAEELRCLVCQNETIAGSNADLAVDLRKQIRDKLSQGQSEQQILDFMVERYGDFVRYRPALKSSTVLLWAGPFVLLALGIAAMTRYIAQRRRIVRQELTADEVQRARALLELDEQ